MTDDTARWAARRDRRARPDARLPVVQGGPARRRAAAGRRRGASRRSRRQSAAAVSDRLRLRPRHADQRAAPRRRALRPLPGRATSGSGSRSTATGPPTTGTAATPTGAAATPRCSRRVRCSPARVPADVRRPPVHDRPRERSGRGVRGAARIRTRRASTSCCPTPPGTTRPSGGDGRAPPRTPTGCWRSTTAGGPRADPCRSGSSTPSVDSPRGRDSRASRSGSTRPTCVVIETDGAIEQVDSLKTAYDGAPATGLDVRHDIASTTPSGTRCRRPHRRARRRCAPPAGAARSSACAGAACTPTGTARAPASTTRRSTAPTCSSW